jgi:hypothetical protein
MIVHFIGYETQRVTLNLTGGELVVPTVKLASSTFGLAEATVMAGAVQGRATPVAVSTLNVEYIERNLGDKELVEVLNVTDWGRYRSALSYSTGIMPSGWSLSLVGSRTVSDGYADGNFIDAWS